MTKYEPELVVALDAAAAAGRYLRTAYDDFAAMADAPVDISTDADRASQEIILYRLRLAFPDDAVCAEEATPTAAAAPRRGPRAWVVDPIDGTRGFVTKNGEFSVMIGLVVEGEVVVGVVLEPAMNRVTFASKGGGCWVSADGEDPTKCRVAKTADAASAALVVSHAKPGKPDPAAARLKPARVVETYSAGVKMAMVARGEVDLYVNTYSQFRDWDIAAGHLLVTEAGGVVTELHGTPVRYGADDFGQRGGLIASNAAVHGPAVAALTGLTL